MDSTTDKEKSTKIALLQLLRKYNFKETEELFRKEANLTDIPIDETHTESDVNSVLSAYKSEGDPALYDKSYGELKKFVEGSLDIYKYELGTILYPVLVHMYLELIYNNHSEEGKYLVDKYSTYLEDYHQNDLKKLAHVTKREHMAGNELIDTFKSNQFIIRISRDTLSIIKRYLQEKKHSILLNIIQEHLYFDMYEGVARNKSQIEATSGALLGEATRHDNKTKVYYGLLKEPDISSLQPTETEEMEDDGGPDPDKPKKKKPKKDSLFSKKTKSDPNAPAIGRMPLPNLKDIDKIEKLKALREASKRINLGPEILPSICFYTLMNSVNTVITAEVSEDSSILAVGFSDSAIKVYSLVPQKLRQMKDGEQLVDIERDADDVLVRMMDEKSAETVRNLHGHSGPVYSLTFSPDKNLLLSCSEDGTLRLWSLHTWTCVVCFKGHIFPIWSVKFSPHGYYFATGSHDKTARLWATDSHQPLRIFAGHYSDVEVVQFHPNSNYIASGSSDMTIRLWDCVTGNQVRLMTGHKGPIHTLAFSMEGRFLASAGADGRIMMWDLAHGHLVAALKSHTGPVYCLSFSRDGTILTSGSLDCTVKLWDFTKLAEEMSLEDVNVSHNPDVKTNTESYLLRSFGTKSTPILTLHFTRRNLLFGIGRFDGS